MSDYTTNLRTSPVILNLRSVLAYVESNELPHRHIGAGTGGPRYVDIGVTTWADVDAWNSALGGTAKINEDGRRQLNVSALGLEWMVYSDEKRPPLPDGEAKAEVEDAEVGLA